MKTTKRTYVAFEIREGTADRQEAEGVNHCLAAPLFHPFNIVPINLLSKTICAVKLFMNLNKGNSLNA